MKKQIIVISSILVVILLVVLVVAQTGTMPTYIPEHINLERTYSTTNRITNQTFGKCLIGDTVKLKLRGYYNETTNSFDYSTSANFGKCVQGMGKRSINLGGITTETRFLQELRADIDERWLEIYNARTTLSTRRIITGS